MAIFLSVVPAERTLGATVTHARHGGGSFLSVLAVTYPIPLEPHQ